jgi:hypothetical protein
MIYHCVRFALNPGLAADEAAQVFTILQRLEELDSVQSVVLGQDLGDPSDGFTDTVLVLIPTVKDYAAYQRAPLHAEMMAYTIPRCARMMVCDFSDDRDPHLRETLAQLAAVGLTDADTQQAAAALVSKETK